MRLEVGGGDKCNSLVGRAVRTDVSYKTEFMGIEGLFFFLGNVYLCISLFKSQQVFIDPKLWAMMNALNNTHIVTSVRV
jgi:hypothetical protein